MFPCQQGEQTGRKRTRKLELVVAGLREQVSALALSEQKASQDKGLAEARATAAELSERELRRAVEAIKDDFEVRQTYALGFTGGRCVAVAPHNIGSTGKKRLSDGGTHYNLFCTWVPVPCR